MSGGAPAPRAPSMRSTHGRISPQQIVGGSPHGGNMTIRGLGYFCRSADFIVAMQAEAGRGWRLV
jgi:hypothetical protein